jgi:hypothetical protein
MSAPLPSCGCRSECFHQQHPNLEQHRSCRFRVVPDRPPAPRPMDLETALALVALKAPMPDDVHRAIEQVLVAELNRTRAEAAVAQQAAARIDTAASHGEPSGPHDDLTRADWQLVLRYARGEGTR